MQLNGNTILITGGNSGIGRAFAEAFHARGNQVIIAGRRQETLDEVTTANPGMKSAVLDVSDADAVQSFARQLKADFPELNVVLHSAGIMRDEDVKSGELDTAEATVATNLLGPIRLTAALLDTLLAQPRAAVITISSGLAFVPKMSTPTYDATKAAIHAYSLALRAQLAGTPVEVIELIPPLVRTALQGEQQARDPNAMPVEDYVGESLHLLDSPDVTEVLVERVKPLRFAEVNGKLEAMMERLNTPQPA